MGKLIVIEGTDGSGKSTQFRLMTQRLTQEGKDFRNLVFPRYSEPSSALIRMYLSGEFGTKPSDVNAYAASAFYAVDRFASYKQDWGQWYEDGGLILSDRYTTSNAVHQASKEPETGREAFLQWLYEFEYDKLSLPRPDLVIYLDVPTDFTEKLMRHREQDTGTQADIHEKDRPAVRRQSSTAGPSSSVSVTVPCAASKISTKRSTAMWRPVWRVNYGLCFAGNRL